MPNYDWIIEKRIEAMRQKLQRRGMPSYRQLPVSERYGVSYTGLGPDGKLDTSAPAGISGSHAFHEGETAARFPEGDLYLDANTTRMVYPESQRQQAEMAAYERTGNLPGFATGGADVSRMQAGSDVIKTSDEIVKGVTNTARPKNTENIKPGISIGGANMPTATAPTISGQKPKTFTSPISMGTQQPTTMQATAPTVQKRQPAVMTSQVALAGQRSPYDMERYRKDMNNTVSPYDTEQYRKDMNAVAGQQGTTEAYRAAMNEMYPQTTPTETATPTTATPTTTVTPAETPSAEETARKTGLEYLQKTVEGDEATRIAGRRAVDELAVRQQQERSALEQRLIQEGVDPGRARIEAQQLRNQQETEMNDLAAQYGIAGMQAQQAAASTLASQGLAGQQFEQEKTQYKDSAGWQAYEAAIAAGDFDTAAREYKGITGKDLSMNQMKTYQEYLNTKQQQEITSGDITIDSMRNKLGDEQYTSVQNMINSGSSLAAVNDRLSKQGRAPLSTQEYQSMLEATSLGERNWGRKMSAANMLLTTPGAQNKVAAAQQYAELFPGVTFDFNQLASDESAERFASGMSQLAGYITSDMSTDDVLAMAKTSGLSDKLPGVNIEQLYNGMKVNAVDAEWEEMETSDFFKQLTQEEQDDQREFFRQKMLGKLDYETVHEYEIYNPDGTLNTTVFGKSSEEADKAAAKLGSGYTVKDTGRVKFQAAGTVATQAASGTVTPSMSGQGTTGHDVGDVFAEGSRIYEVGSGGALEELSIDDSTDVWSSNMDKVLSIGKEGNPLYDKLVEARANEITAGERQISGKIENEDVLNAVNKKTPVTTFTIGSQRWTYGGEDLSRPKTSTTVGTFDPPPQVGKTIKLSLPNESGESEDVVFAVTSEAEQDTSDQIAGNEAFFAVDVTTGKKYKIAAAKSRGGAVIVDWNGKTFTDV